MKNQNGITLIALIITIIVMLILVAVTVTTAVQSGLFNKAGEATQGWKEKENDELHLDEKITSNGATGINAIVNQYTNARETESNS